MNLTKKDIFKQRFYSKIILLSTIVILYGISSVISGFQNGMAFSSIPAGIFWLLQKFIPTQNALQYFPEILDSALKTVLLAITSTMISSIFALFLAIIGSNSTGINIFTKIITKVIASFFRNIPIVAWALILVFSFKQSQFTGFLALFLITFGYLTRCCRRRNWSPKISRSFILSNNILWSYSKCILTTCIMASFLYWNWSSWINFSWYFNRNWNWIYIQPVL